MGVVAEEEKYSAKLAPIFSKVPMLVPLRNTKNCPSSASLSPSFSESVSVISAEESASSVVCSLSLTLTRTLPSDFSNTILFVAFLSLSAVAGAVSNVRLRREKSVSLNANFMDRYFASVPAFSPSAVSNHFKARSRLKETLLCP